jgi:ATP-dependent DNA helicase DinG
VERFRRHSNTILLGTSSFWEGIDIPGEELSCVFIPKLPFPMPDDPVIASLADADNLDAFSDLSVPHMILRLRQGIGRLLRTSHDRGVVIFADGRFLRSAYGETVLRNLPAATIKIGSKNELLAAVENWFGESTLSRWRSGG